MQPCDVRVNRQSELFQWFWLMNKNSQRFQSVSPSDRSVWTRALWTLSGRFHVLAALSSRHMRNICLQFRPRQQNRTSASFRGASEICPSLKLLQRLLLLPVSGGWTATILRGLTNPKILCRPEKVDRKTEYGDIAWCRSSLSRAWAAEIMT